MTTESAVTATTHRRPGGTARAKRSNSPASPATHRPPPGHFFAALTSLYVWLAYSRIVELSPVPGVLFGLAMVLLLYALGTNRWQALGSVPTALFAGITVLMLPSGLLGLWPGGSLGVVKDIWRGSLLVYLALVCLVQDAAGIRRTVCTVAYAVSTIVVLGFVLGGEKAGRLIIGRQTLGNPNELATFLAIGLPFCTYVLLERGGTLIGRLIMLATVPLTLLMILQTGSRAAILALAALVGVLALVCSWRTRVWTTIAVLLAVVAGIMLLPEHLQRRYGTLWSDSISDVHGSRQVEYATGSAQARWRIFLTSLEVAAKNPLLGVGPGNFAVANAAITSRAGEDEDWHQTHNAYTQVMSECGIPAGLLFIGLTGFCLTTANRWRRAASTAEPLRGSKGLPLCLLAATVIYIVCATFSNIAYLIHLPLLAALAVALDSTCRRDVRHSPRREEQTARHGRTRRRKNLREVMA